MLDASKAPTVYHYHSLGKVQVKGEKKPVAIIELLDGLPEDELTI